MATALMVLGVDEGYALAERLGLAVAVRHARGGAVRDAGDAGV
jgi:hypothetical protein